MTYPTPKERTQIKWSETHVQKLGLTMTYASAHREWPLIIAGSIAPSPAFCAAMDWASLGSKESGFLRKDLRWVARNFVPYVRGVVGDLLDSPLDPDLAGVVAVERYGPVWRKAKKDRGSGR